MSRLVAVGLAIAATIAPAGAPAHHPGTGLDAAIGERERYFQAVDEPAPDFVLRDGDGRTVRLDDLRDAVVVLHFVYASCADVCPLHTERIAQVQDLIAETPMKDLVRFLTITTDPANDTARIISEYGAVHGLDPANWSFLTILPGQREDSTRRLAERFGHTFTTTPDGRQAHGVVTHVIDRGGRWAANFHGLRFTPVNLVVYVNGLINNAHAPPQAEPGLWERLRRLF